MYFNYAFLCLTFLIHAFDADASVRYNDQINPELNWIMKDGRCIPALDTFVQVIQNSEWEGLDASSYKLEKIKSLRLQIKSEKNIGIRDRLIKEANTLINKSFTDYLIHIHVGIASAEHGNTLRSSKLKSLNLTDSLKKVIVHGSVRKMIDGMNCRYFRYNEFKSMLRGCLIRRIKNETRDKKEFVSNENLIAELKINMERCRWLPKDISDTFIEVNIPEFNLRLLMGIRELFNSNVIVGMKKHQTPVLYSRLDAIVFNPFWNVPLGIASRDIWPKVKKNRRYLKQHHYKVVKSSLDGKIIYRIVQDPGPWNSLGQVKFEFFNQKMVYIHDTPYKELFKKSQRTLSNGCVRLQDPLALASILTGIDSTNLPVKKMEKDKYVSTKVNYKGECDILIVYLTIMKDENGEPIILKDVYGKNKSLSHHYSLFRPDPTQTYRSDSKI